MPHDHELAGAEALPFKPRDIEGRGLQALEAGEEIEDGTHEMLRHEGEDDSSPGKATAA